MNGQRLNNCGCCGGVTSQPPKNPAGLTALAYRVGRHSTFNETMRAGISKQPALRPLTTRADDDPSIALIDAWATVLDVLGFYQERIANEGYLRTATERRSTLELARSIGYELRPGVAASTYLAFTLETPKDAPPVKTKIGVGTKAQSIPKQDETPQLFETVEEIEARGDWNELRPQTRKIDLPQFDDEIIYLVGTETGLQPGDALLIIGKERAKSFGSENWDFRKVKEVEPVRKEERADDYTAVTLDYPLGSKTPRVWPARKEVKVYALRQRASIFGYNALPWSALPYTLRVRDTSTPHTPGPFSERKNSWADKRFDPGETKINLDTVYPKITAGSWIVLSVPSYDEVFRVTEAVEENKADFLLAAKTTRLAIEGEHIHYYSPRTATVYGQSEPLDLAARPETRPVEGEWVVLSTAVEGLVPGRKLAFSGIDDLTGEAVAEIATLKSTVPDGDLTRLNFTGNLEHTYRRETVRINANVARATHGETKNEVLGSGDGSQAFQKFGLKQKPLTYVSASTPNGVASTLEVRVNGVLWDEVPSFYQCLPEKRAYVTRLADDGQVTVEFGDGVNGARTPTGQENISAKARIGIGLGGLVEAGQISLLLTRPLGVKEVINPTAPTGAADPEKFAQARQNAPLTVLTLDRIVSVQDFEDFTRAFTGIGKAQATLLWDGERQLVHLTVAGADGGSVPATSELFEKLIAGIDAARHPDQPVRVASFQALEFNIVARILAERGFIPADLFAEIKIALVAQFCFAERKFGQAVTESEVVAAIQEVDGVTAADLDALHFSSHAPGPASRLPAHTAHWSLSEVAPAELITLNPNGITLTEMEP
jgi:predicted phage baseplate assembly protein